MFWDDCTSKLVIYSKCNDKPTARKEHKCCECGETIKIGEKYSYFGGLWVDDYHTYGGKHFKMYATCFKCEKDWDEILDVYWKNENSDAGRVYGGKLGEAIQDAYDLGYLTETDRLVNEWLDIWPEVDPENLSPEERKNYEREEAVAQMRVHSAPLL